MRRLNRLWNWFRAQAGGYYWLPCRLCGENYGGHEAGRYSLASGNLVCSKPECQKIARESWRNYKHPVRPA